MKLLDFAKRLLDLASEINFDATAEVFVFEQDGWVSAEPRLHTDKDGKHAIEIGEEMPF